MGAAGWQLGRAFGQTAPVGGASESPFEAALAGPPQGPWRRLFLDAWAVEQQQGLTRVFHAAEKHPASPVLKGEKPWECVPAAITGPYVYGTVAWEGDRLRIWYQILTKGNHVACAESQALPATKTNFEVHEPSVASMRTE